jgi:CubicO group peptidase (beta-lactamase class C family)
MTRRLLSVSLLAATCLLPALTFADCDFERLPAGTQKIGRWIDKSNWLLLEHQRLTLLTPSTFMPALRLAPPAGGDKARPTGSLLDLDSLKLSDPLDGRDRDLGFLLDSRLRADGIVVYRAGKLVAERYRNGLRGGDPRLVLSATRPLLSLLGAIGIGQGKLAADRSVGRYIPVLANQSGIRKLSVQRLLDGNDAHEWSPEELVDWRHAGGWLTDQRNADLRAWLNRPGRWERPLSEQATPVFAGNPDDDLLAWLLAESNATPLSRLFCEQLLSRAQPESPVLWLIDDQGKELADGLAMSLRDFAKLGNQLLEARTSRTRSRIPNWFVETLTASSGLRSGEIPGLAKGSELRYGFVHLGGKANRAALIGAHGNSLYVDFDNRLVVAIYASYPSQGSPAMLANLEQAWKTISAAQRGR